MKLIPILCLMSMSAIASSQTIYQPDLDRSIAIACEKSHTMRRLQEGL
jgi:hypothetical protein